MLRHSFCQLPGVGSKSEHKLWQRGILTWDDLRAAQKPPISPLAKKLMPAALDACEQALARGDAAFFADKLPPAKTWRLFTHFAQDVAYLDIETTGLSRTDDHITSVAIIAGGRVQTFVYDDNLDNLQAALDPCKLLVTFSGKSFDAPVLQQQLGIRLPPAHIDLRYVLSGLGLRGGLKSIEHQLGLGRGELEGVDGKFAITLWYNYINYNSPTALETLLAYNVADVLQLETLLFWALDKKLQKRPFDLDWKIPAPHGLQNPFRVDTALVRKLLRS